MLSTTRHISCSTWVDLQHAKPHLRSQTLFLNPSSNLAIFNLKENKPRQTLSKFPRLQRFDKGRRGFVVYNGVEPGIPPSGPPSNILSWIVGVAIAVVVPFISYKWGPLLKNKLDAAMQMTENVAEAVEKVAEEVEKAAEDIADNLPAGGKLREAVDFVEKIAERAAKDAGAVDDFIDKVQAQEEKAESLVESLKDEPNKPNEESNNVESVKDESKKPNKESNDGKSDDQNLNK